MDTTPPDSFDAATGEPTKRTYWCFISYRHADNKVPGRQWATWLHQALETYEVPSDLVGTRNERGDIIPDRIFPVFRDEEELPADAELSSPIEAALRRSRFLVVLCSPQAAQSRFVASEVLRFKELGKKDRILAAIIEGEPNATDDPLKGGPQRECFPGPLRFDVNDTGQLTGERTEPIAADFRLPDGTPGWTTPAPYREALRRAGLPDEQIGALASAYQKQQNLMLLKIVAGVLGVPLGVLTKRDQAYQLEKQKQRARVLRRWLVVLAVLALATIVSAMWAWQKQRQAVASARLAEERQQEAVAAARLAQERQYLAGIQAAAAQLEDGKPNAARQTLITLPKGLRQREWFFLLEWAGAPIVSTDDLGQWMDRHEKDQPQLIAQIRAAAKMLDAQAALDRDKRERDIPAPNGSCRVFTEYGHGRPGGSLAVVNEEWRPQPDEEWRPQNDENKPSEFAKFSTTPYGAINGVAFTPDSSILLVQASSITEYSGPPVHDLGGRLSHQPRESDYYIIPVPNRFYPDKAANPTGKTKSRGPRENTTETEKTKSASLEKQSAELKRTITIGARHGKEVVASVQIETDNPSKYRHQRPWPGAARSAMTSGTAEWEGTSRVALDLLPDPVRLNAMKLMEERKGKPKRALAAVRYGPAGTEGLFFVVGGPALLERWDLEKNQLIGQLGSGLQPKQSADGSLSDWESWDFMLDWGAAYNRDATLVLALPISDDYENGAVPGIFDVATGKLLQKLPPISFAGSKARGAYPFLGFSFSGNYVYASIYDAADVTNSIWIARREADGFVPLPSEKIPAPPKESETPDPDTAKESATPDPDADESETVDDDSGRFVAWSPDDARRYEVASDTLEVISAGGASRYSLPNAVRSGGGPVFDELRPAAEKSAEGRYAFGGFIFSRFAPEPLLRLPVVWMDPEMRSVVLRNRVGNYDLITGSLLPGAEQAVETAAMLLLKWWINMADTKPGGSQGGAAASQALSQPTASAIVSPIAAVSPTATSIAPFASATPSPAAKTAPGGTTSTPRLTSAIPAPSARATLTPPGKASPAAASMTLAEAERQLTIAYTALRKTMSEAAKQKLKREQIEWIKRKDAIANSSERVSYIRQRTEEFERQIGKLRE